MQWLELLLPFTAVKNLLLPVDFALPPLQELTGGKVEVLLALHNLFVEELQSLGPVHETFELFAAVQQISSHLSQTGGGRRFLSH